jgi:hypothetical protein
VRVSFLRLVFLTAIAAAIGIKAVFWVYGPRASPQAPDTNDAPREAAAPAGTSVIAGIVYDEHGRPAPGRSVRLMREGNAETSHGQRAPLTINSDAEGRYRFEALPAGSYIVLAAFNELATARVFHPGASRVAEASPVAVGDDEERTGVDLRFRPSPTALLEGVVSRPDGTPVRITVDLILAAAPEPERVRLTTGTDDQGRFSFGDVPADEYWIVAHTQVRGTVASENPIAARPLVAIDDVSTDGRTPVRVSLVARPAMTVSAHLTFAGAADAAPDARDRSGMVRLAGRDRRTRALLALIDTPTRGDADGLVTIHGVPAGRYALTAGSDVAWRLESASLAGAILPSMAFDVTDGTDVAGLRIALARAGQHASK